MSQVSIVRSSVVEDVRRKSWSHGPSIFGPAGGVGYSGYAASKAESSG
jgi:hypothetical protein